MRNIYERAVAEMDPQDIDHSNTGTDLYLRVTDISRTMVAEYEFRRQVTTFIDQIDHNLWFDIPFAYTPGWERRCR